MGKRYLNHARHKAAEHDRIQKDIRDISHVEDVGRKAFQEGGKFADIVGTERADYLIRQAAISKASYCSIETRYRPSECFPDMPGRRDPYGPWELDNKDVTEDQINKAIDKLKLRPFMTEKNKQVENDKPSLKDRLLNKIQKNAGEAKETEKSSEKSIDIK